MAQINAGVLNELSTKILNSKLEPEKFIRDKLVLLAKQMLELQKQFHSAKPKNDKKIYQKKIEIIDK